MTYQEIMNSHVGELEEQTKLQLKHIRNELETLGCTDYVISKYYDSVLDQKTESARNNRT